MRWKFLFDETDPDFARKQQKLSAIESFWAAFADNTGSLLSRFKSAASGEVDSVTAWIHEHLRKVDDRLRLEVGVEPEGRLKLSITPDRRIELRPLTETILEMAPDLPGWAYSGYREPVFPELLHSSFKTKTGRLIPDDLRFYMGSTYRNDVSLHFGSSSFIEDNKEHDLTLCRVLVDLVMGEEMTQKWLGELTTGNGEDRKFHQFGSTEMQSARDLIEDLKTQFQFVRNEIINLNPSELFLRSAYDQSQWHPLTFDDEPRKLDRRHWASLAPRLARAAADSILHRQQFYSCRHSNFAEVFCFIKTESRRFNLFPFFTANAQTGHPSFFEKEVDGALRAAGCGAVIGGSFGPQYDFVDLALTDVAQAVPILKETCARQALGPRTWLLFYDSHYKDEWVGLHHERRIPF